LTDNRTTYHFEDFTESNYRDLIQLAKKNFDFVPFNLNLNKENIVIWRHDIDLSPHRALKLAAIEKNENVTSTYFFNLHCEFYNLLEPEISGIIKKIIALGHNIGIHFDPNYYGEKIKTLEHLEHCLNIEKLIFRELLGTEIKVFSYHDPNKGNWHTSFEENEIAGLVNAYGKYFKDNFEYCSDSNGYWRFKRLKDVLTNPAKSRLQVLTHPGWWQETVMSPKERVWRCIEERAQNTKNFYQHFIADSNRELID
jgi:hypothetical protein